MAHVSRISITFLILAVSALGSGCQSDFGDRFPALEMTPDRFFFGRVVQSTRATRVVELRNTGGAELIIDRVEFDAPASIDVLTLGWGEDEATPGVNGGIDADGLDAFPYPLRIAPGQALYLEAAWTPQGDMPEPAAVRLSTNLPAVEVLIPLVLDEGAPQINVEPAFIDFDRVEGGGQALVDVTVSNIGQQPLVLELPTIDGSDDFLAVAPGFPDALDPGEPHTFQVRYAPRFEGPDLGELRLVSNDPNRPEVVVGLAGNAGIPCLIAAPQVLEFRSSLVDRTDSRSVSAQSCGGRPVTIERIELEAGTDEAFVLDLPALPIRLPAAEGEGPLPSVEIPVQFTPRAERLHRGALVIYSDDPEKPIRRVPLLGRGAINACPRARAAVTDYVVAPGDAIFLDGSPSVDPDGADNRPIQWRWSVPTRPDGSVEMVYEAPFDLARPCDGGPPDDTSTPTAYFCPILAGNYGLQLDVTDSLGLQSEACDAGEAISIQAVPDEAIHVQVTWRAPGDPDPEDGAGPDVDLHFFHPLGEWNQAPYDCYFGNPTPDWGQIGNPEDDPILDRDDVGGGGPENVRLAQPESTELLGAPYAVGIEYYRDDNSVDGTEYGPVFVTVRAFVRGELVWQYDRPPAEGALPGEIRLDAEGDRWLAFELDWPSGDVRTLDRRVAPRPAD